MSTTSQAFLAQGLSLNMLLFFFFFFWNIISLTPTSPHPPNSSSGLSLNITSLRRLSDSTVYVSKPFPPIFIDLINEIIVGLLAVVEVILQRFHVPLPKVILSCNTIVQYHHQDINNDTINQSILFMFLRVYLYLFVWACVCLFVY